MNKNKEIYAMGENYLMATYNRLYPVFTRAKMQYLWDADGKKYVDFIAGYGCLNVGHSNKTVIKALCKQIKDLIQPSNVYYNYPQVKLAKKLCEITGFGQKVFFTNSGTESIEGSIKLARKYSTDKYNHGRYEIISFNKSFHGRTLGALAATAQPHKQKLFEPLLKGFKYADLNNVNSVSKLINQDTCAILLEPVQGEGGIYPATGDFLEDLKQICDKNDLLLIFDEVQTGFCRTGKIFSYQSFGICPDILVLAKSLGGGMPIGAIISTDKICSAFTPGTHGSTFGGNAASCAAGLAVIEFIESNKIEEKVYKLGEYFVKKLSELKRKYKTIKEIRGMGLMIGMEFEKPVAWKIVNGGLENGFVLNKVSDNILRFLPPLIIKKNDINKLINWLNKILKDI